MTLPDPVKVSRDLAEIIALEPALFGQAVTLARAKVDGTSLPGGAAMVSLAPVARLSTWTDRILEAEARWHAAHPDAHADRDHRPDFGGDEDDSWEPALQTLRFWSDHYRRVLGMQYDVIPTIGTEARFLRHETVLPWIFDHEPNLDRFAQDINDARQRLENIVHAGRRAERTRIVCDHCDKQPQLIKVYAARVCATCGTPAPPPDKPQHCRVCSTPNAEWVSDPAHDRWKCPNCKHRYDADGLRRAHARQLRHESAARYLPLDEARATLVSQGRSERTIRKWLAPAVEEVDVCTVCRRQWEPDEWPVCQRKLKHCGVETGEVCGGELRRGWRGDRDAVVDAYCEIATHRVMVWWPDLWRLHLTTGVRRSRAS